MLFFEIIKETNFTTSAPLFKAIVTASSINLLVKISLSISPNSILYPLSFINSSKQKAKNSKPFSKYPKSPVLKLLFSYFFSNF